MLLKLEGFKYAISLVLNMGYYHIKLENFSKSLFTLTFSCGKHEMQVLPMGLSNSPDNFQEKKNELLHDLEFVRAYIDDLLIVTNGTFQDHLNKLDRVLSRISRARLKINATKSFFCQHELEYLGYWITRYGIQPLPKTSKRLKTFPLLNQKKKSYDRS